MINIPSHPQADSYISLLEADEIMKNRSEECTAWAGYDSDVKQALLVRATRQIDSFRFHHCKIFENPAYYRGPQSLKFPRTQFNRVYSGKVTSVEANNFICSGLASRSDMYDDMWKDGAVVITGGLGKGKTYGITAFDSSTGKITVDANFDPAIDTTSTFYLINKIPDAVRFATLEQAIFLANGGGNRAKMQSEGVKSYSIGDLSETFVDGAGGRIAISAEAKSMLSGYISVIGVIE